MQPRQSYNIINSDNSELYIGENCYIDAGGLTCICGNAAFKRSENASMRIGNNVSIGGVQMLSYNSNAYISVGDDCMMAWGIMIYNTDAHPIYALDSKSFSESNTAIAGNPAKIVKKGIYWKQYDEEYIDNK